MFSKQVFRLTLIALNILLSAVCHAALRDPTTPLYSNGTARGAAAARSQVALSAIRISSQSKWAVINGILGRQGQTLPGDIEIIEIRPKSVLIKRKGKIRELHLIGRQYKKY